MDDLNWLKSQRLEELHRKEYQWTFRFDASGWQTVECMWRLIEGGRIRLTNLDDAQQFGLPAPVDAERILREKLIGSPVVDVVLQEGTLDLEIRFDNGHSLQIVPNSSGYEAWTFKSSTHLYVALGGGDLAVWGPQASGG